MASYGAAASVEYAVKICSRLQTKVKDVPLVYFAGSRVWGASDEDGVRESVVQCMIDAEGEAVGAYCGELTPEGEVPAWPRDGYTRFVAISDTHDKTGALRLPEGDVMLHAGDFSSTGTLKQVQSFVAFLQEHRDQFEDVVVIAGNHDLTFDLDEYEGLAPRFHRRALDAAAIKAMIAEAPELCTYLEDGETTVHGGLRVYGSPWQPEFCGWGFNLDRGQPLMDKWAMIPDDGIDVLITHGPPKWHGDACKGSGFNAGCEMLLADIVERTKPQAHVFGHIHEGYGVTQVAEDGVDCLFVNASTCNYSYRPWNPPIVFDLPHKA